MEKTRLSSFHVVSIVFMFNITSIIVFSGFNRSGSAFIIAPFIAGIISIFSAYLFYHLMKKYPGKSLSEISEILIGKTGSKIISALLFILSFYLSVRIIKNTALVIHTVSLDKTPEYSIMICIAALALYGISAGKEGIMRLAVISFFIAAISLIATMSLNIKNITYDFLPGFSNFKIGNILPDVLDYFIFPFSENILLYNFLSKQENPDIKPIIIGNLLSGLTLGIIGFITCGVIGFNNAKDMLYPFYTAVSVISVGKSFSRIEIIIGATLIFSPIIKLLVCFNCIKDYGTSIVLKTKKQLFSIITTVLIVLVCFFITGDNYHLSRTLNEYLLIAPVVSLGIPVLLSLRSLKINDF